MDVGGQLGVVVADDRELVREGETVVLGDGEPGDRHHVVGVDDCGGRRLAGQQRARGGDASGGGEVGELEQLRLEAPLAHRALPGVAAARAVHERLEPGDVRDPLVAEVGEVVDGVGDAGAVVEADRRERARLIRPADGDGGEAELHAQPDARVVEAQVAEEDAVDAPALGEALVAGRLGARVVAGHLQQERVLERGQLRLDAGDEGGEEGVGAEQRRVAGEDEAEGVGA